MDRNEIRRKTCVIIRKHGLYLAGRDWITDGLRWTWSTYEAWKTRDIETAREIARRTGGIMVLFNPILGQTKVM